MRGMLQTFTIEGLNMERLLTQAAAYDVQILGLRRTGRRMTGCVRMDELPLLQTMAAEGGWRMMLGEPKGLASLVAFIRKRWLICVLMGVMLGMTGYATQLIWHIELLDAGAYEADIRTFLNEIDVHPFKMRQQIDLSALRNDLEWRYPRIAWIDCSWRGGTLCIRVVEGSNGNMPFDHHGNTDMVASRSGVVTSVVTLAGTPQVKVGQTVRKGEVLIRGEERIGDGNVRPVAARGTVLARVWDGAAVKVSGMGIETTYTGAEWTAYQAVTPWFVWPEIADPPFSDADRTVSEWALGGYFLPIQVRRITWLEAERSMIPMNQEEIRAQAGEIALRKLHEKVGYDEDFVDKWVDYSMIENGDSIATAICERVVDIAVRSDPP